MKYQEALTFSECRVKHLELEMCHQRKLSELSHNILSSGFRNVSSSPGRGYQIAGSEEERSNL